jgi:hypothetical protein
MSDDSIPQSSGTPAPLDELVERAQSWFPDVDPPQLKRVIEQSFSLNRYDDHDLIAFAFVCSMLKASIPIEDVVQIVAFTKLNLMGQQYLDSGAHPDAITE